MTTHTGFTPSTDLSDGTARASLTAIQGLSLATALGGAITGGVLFAFSAFVLPALQRLPVADAIAAMQAVNLQAPRSLLMIPLIGSAVGSAAVAVLAVTRHGTSNRAWLVIGAAAGIVAFAITAAYHVPHNDALARLDPHANGSAALWAQYTRGWARWNHVRTASALVSAIALVGGVLRTPR